MSLWSRDMGSHEFAWMWQRYGAEIRRSCQAWMGGRTADAEEAFSRAGMLAFQKFERHGPRLTNPRGWLFKLAYHACMDLHRERRRRRELGFDHLEGDLAQPPDARVPDPEQRVLQQERRERIRRWVQQLPPRLRETVSLHVYEARSYRDIAADLGITEPNVRKRMQEARHLLRARARAAAGRSRVH